MSHSSTGHNLYESLHWYTVQHHGPDSLPSDVPRVTLQSVVLNVPESAKATRHEGSQKDNHLEQQKDNIYKRWALEFGRTMRKKNYMALD